MTSRVVIVGAGETGQELARRLSQRHEVLLVDRDANKLVHIHSLFDSTSKTIEPSQEPNLKALSGDATSRLVLETLYLESVKCALLAIAGDDETNLEVGRLGRAIGFDPVIAVQCSRQFTERYRGENITTLDRTQLLADEVERSLRHRGAVVPRGVGLGRGELLEIRLQRTSPILDRPLKELAPHRWRIAAVFRGDELIVPMGDTTLIEDDRVLLVGDPDILPTVMEYLRLGTPQFPQPFGPHFVTLELEGPDEAMLKEARYLQQHCNAAGVVRGVPDAAHLWPEDDLAEAEDDPDVAATFSVPFLSEKGFGQQVHRQRPGLVLARPRFRSYLSRLFGTRGDNAQICDQVSSPVLFARGSHPYRRILLPVSYSSLNIRATEVAIDLTRQLNATLTAMNVDLPKYISGLEEEVVHEEVLPIRRLCDLYEVNLEYCHKWGNPVRHLTEEAGRHDLVVVARRATRGDSYFDPDVAMRVARAAPCSVLVLTVGAGAA